MSHDQAVTDQVTADHLNFGFASQHQNGGGSSPDPQSRPTSDPSLIGDAVSSQHRVGELESRIEQDNNVAVVVVASSPLESTSRDRSSEGPPVLQTLPHASVPAGVVDHSLDVPISLGQESITSSISSSQPPTLHKTKSKESKVQSNSSSTGMPSSTNRPTTMFFGSAHRRRNMANTNALTNYEADMNNKDRAKQKEAVQRFLEETIDDEWEFVWPRPAKQPDYKYVDELGHTGREAERWKERDEWLSNTNDSDDEPALPTAASPDTASPTSETYKFESPDDVGEAIKKRELAHKRRRERKLKEELEQNEGLRCFVARRDAWTGARRVRRKSIGTSPKTHNNNTGTIHDATSANNSTEDLITSKESGYENDSSSDDEMTEIPVAPPLLPPTNPIRASITPVAYKTIYDKVVIQSLTPSCPVNLKDLMHSCVQGWKRDGEWPPKGTAPEPTMAGRKKARKMSVASIFGLGKNAEEGEKDAGNDSGLRKSIQKIFGKKEANGVTTANGHGNGVAQATGNGHAAAG